MKNHRKSHTMHFPKLTRLAAAVAGGLLLAPTLAMAQAGYQEAGRIGDAGSWRTNEFKKDWGLAAVGAEFAYARGLSGAGINAGVMDDGIASWHSELKGKTQGMTVKDVGCESREVFMGPDGCFNSDGGSRFSYVQPFSPKDMAEFKTQLNDGKITQEDYDYYESLGGYSYETHGTHVAGTVGAMRNGAGMHGVAFNVELHATTFSADTYRDAFNALDPSIGFYTTKELAGEALDQMFAQMAARKVRVMNHSWGAISVDTASEMDALATQELEKYAAFTTWAKNNDAIQVWAAGNLCVRQHECRGLRHSTFGAGQPGG